MDLLWDVIDSLVDEADDAQRAAIALVRAMERGTPTAELRYYKDVARIEVASKEG